MRRSWVALLALAALEGCSLANGVQAGPPAQTNACSTDSDCGETAVCVALLNESGEPVKACAALSVQLPDLLLEVIPPASAQGTNTSYLVPISELAIVLQGGSPAGVVTQLDLDLPPLVAIKPGTLYLDASYQGKYTCVGPDGSYPADVELRRVAPASAMNLSLGGQLAKSYQASSDLVTLPDGTQSWRFDLAVPPGDYDLYVVPRPCAGDPPAPPPSFFPGQVIDGATGFDVTLPASERLAGAVLPPPSADLRGYFIEVLEPATGRALSAPTPLVASGAEFTFDLPFSWGSKSYVPIVRVRPPGGGGDPTCAASCGTDQVCSALDATCLDAGTCQVDEDCASGQACVQAACVAGGRPSVHYSLEALALQGTTENVALDMSDLPFDVRQVSGQAVDLDGQPVVGTIQLRSTKLEGSALNATFEFSVDTDASGVFEAWIPLGTYRVVARPNYDPSKALAQRELTIPAGDGCFCGQAIEVPERTNLVGECGTWLGASPGAAQAVASPAILELAYFSDALGLAPVPPREAEGLVEADGHLSVLVDPGPLDLSIRPDPRTLLPWLVRPRLTVQVADAGLDSDLGELTLGAPAFLFGTIYDSDKNSVSSATIRAWLPVEDVGGKKRAVLIGEAVTKGSTYLLPLPSSVPH